MSRNGLLTFLKLSIAAIAAILLAIASYFLHIDKGKEPRFAMLAASVFALVVSLQTAAGAGGEASLTLVDRFHTVALAYVVVAVVVSIIAHIMFNRDVSMDRINRLERNAGISSTAVLVVLLIFLFTTN
jgi:heme/copper-type cytochrome/quinol oxidase subunit 4